MDYKTPISIVSSIAMSRQNDKLYNFIVVTKNYKYIGTVTIKDLLIQATKLEIATAKHQNPLSGLPGNLIIDQKISQYLKSNTDFSIVYFDIDNFKAYNDVYGFGNGDLIIKLLANILNKQFSDEHFVGHIGGDDFLAIIKGYVKEDYFENIIKQFEFEVLKFYNETDINNGYITTANRHGCLENFPLLSLTTVVINNKDYHLNNNLEVSELLAKKKKLAKQKKVN